MPSYKEVVTTGPIEWARVFEGNRDMNGYEGAYQECDGAYTLVQVLSKAEYEKLKKAGSQKKPKMTRLTEQGEIAINFERKHTVKKKDGSVVEKAGGAPKVVNKDGKAWDVETDGPIGNGFMAEVTSLITSFPGQDGKIISRTTLVKVKVLEQVQFEANQDEAA